MDKSQSVRRLHYNQPLKLNEQLWKVLNSWFLGEVLSEQFLWFLVLLFAIWRHNLSLCWHKQTLFFYRKSTVANLCPNMINFDEVINSECRSEEVIDFFWLSVYFILTSFLMKFSDENFSIACSTLSQQHCSAREFVDWNELDLFTLIVYNIPIRCNDFYQYCCAVEIRALGSILTTNEISRSFKAWPFIMWPTREVSFTSRREKSCVLNIGRLKLHAFMFLSSAILHWYVKWNVILFPASFREDDP